HTRFDCDWSSDVCSSDLTSLSPNTMTSARATHTATLLPSGKVLIAGGYTDEYATATNTAELFDPALGTFTSLSPNTMSSLRLQRSEERRVGKECRAGWWE